MSKTPKVICREEKFPGNKLEQAFASRLGDELKLGRIRWWGYEPIKLKMGLGAWYTPDFGVVEKDSSFTFYETKGSFFREAAKVRFKVAKLKYPFFNFVVARKPPKGVWTFSDF